MPGPGKPFQKGAKPGPGRPPVPPEFKAQCRDFSPKVFEKWKAEVEFGGENWVKCSELIVAYGHGKPAQTVDLGSKEGGALSVQIIRRVAK